MLTEKQEKQLLEILERDKKFSKIVNEEYGDTLEFLGKQWSNLAWMKGVSPEEGAELIEAIVDDIKTLFGKLVEKKQNKLKGKTLAKPEGKEEVKKDAS